MDTQMQDVEQITLKGRVLVHVSPARLRCAKYFDILYNKVLYCDNENANLLSKSNKNSNIFGNILT